MDPKRLWDWRGRVGRRDYLIWGVLLFAIKYTVDRWSSLWLFDRKFDPMLYLHPFDRTALNSVFDGAPLAYGMMLLLFAVPFAAAGLGLTIQRLRDAGVPTWGCLFFFVPYVNILLFVALLALASKDAPFEPKGAPRWAPRSGVGSAMAGLLVTIPPALIVSTLAIEVFSTYALGLFLGVPFLVGFLTSVIYNLSEDRGASRSVAVGALAQLILGLAFLIIAIEGLICIVMASPIALFFGAIGSSAGYFIASARHPPRKELLLMPFVLILLMGAESAMLPEHSDEREVLSSIEIDAPPEEVWPSVIAFADLPRPDDWLFRTGIAYPMRAEIRGEGTGAVRHCVFSTGPFVEPITEWDPPARLAFDVASQPDAMDEMSPWPDVHAEHLNGYLRIQRGRFDLIRLADGRTRLEGRTWYRQGVWPSLYWEPWSDWIIHRIHLRVLGHIRTQVEK